MSAALIVTLIFLAIGIIGIVWYVRRHPVEESREERQERLAAAEGQAYKELLEERAARKAARRERQSI